MGNGLAEAANEGARIITQNNLVLQNYLTSYASEQKSKSKKKKKKATKKSNVPLTFELMLKRTEMLPKPVELIVGYLGTSCGPGLDVFRLKMLCNQSRKVVNRQAKCEDVELKQAHSRYCSISMFNNMDFLKYQGNCDKFSEIYSNQRCLKLLFGMYCLPVKINIVNCHLYLFLILEFLLQSLF